MRNVWSISLVGINIWLTGEAWVLPTLTVFCVCWQGSSSKNHRNLTHPLLSVWCIHNSLWCITHHTCCVSIYTSRHRTCAAARQCILGERGVGSKNKLYFISLSIIPQLTYLLSIILWLAHSWSIILQLTYLFLLFISGGLRHGAKWLFLFLRLWATLT